MIPDKVRRVLEEHGLEAIEFQDGSTPTAALAARELGVTVGRIAKSIVVCGKEQRLAMIVCAGDRRLSNAKVKALLGSKVSMASAEEIEASTGFRPGGVCPFGVALPVFIDQSLAQYETVYPAAGTDGSGVPVSFDKLVAITSGRVCDVTTD